MSRLLLMRHGPAGNAREWAPQDDDLRPLTAKGRKVVRQVGKRLAKLGAAPTVILHSPLARAAETARVVAQALEVEDRRVECEALRAETPPAEALDLLRAHLADGGLVVAVGHQPDVSRLAALLVAGDEEAGIDLGKGGWCVLEADEWTPGRCARLLALENPGGLGDDG